MPNDMQAVIVARSDQTNADDLITGPKTITITKVDVRPNTEQPVSVYYEGDAGKPYKPGLSMRRIMVYAWGPESKDYVGRSMTLYRDPTVVFGKLAVGGIRISHMSHLGEDMEVALRASKGVSKLFGVKPLANAPSNAAAKRDSAPAINVELLLTGAQIAAARGDEALTEHLKTLSREQRDALRPHGDDLRKQAAAVRTGTAFEPSA